MEEVPQRERRAGEIERGLGERLVVAVQRNTRQRHQMPPVHREQDALARRGSLCSTPFFAQKSRQLAAMGVKDGFGAHARAFLSPEVALLEGDNPSRLQLGSLTVDGTVLAMFSGTICHNRLCRCAVLTRRGRAAAVVAGCAAAQAPDRGGLRSRALPSTTSA